MSDNDRPHRRWKVDDLLSWMIGILIVVAVLVGAGVYLILRSDGAPLGVVAPANFDKTRATYRS